MSTKTVYVVQSRPKTVKAFANQWSERVALDDLGEAMAYKKASELNSVNVWRIIKRTEEIVYE